MGSISPATPSGVRQSLESSELGNVQWPPVTGNPAGGLAGVKIDMAPLRRLWDQGPSVRESYGRCAAPPQRRAEGCDGPFSFVAPPVIVEL